MTSDENRGEQRLRLQAEQRVEAQLVPTDAAPLSPEAVESMLHELRVHQIELEMQNDELRRAQVSIDASRARYFDLYDLAPVGYCTVSDKGLILEANLTAATLLGVTRTALVKRPLSRFIVKNDQDHYFLCRTRLNQTAQPQSCELRLLKSDGVPFWASLAASAAHDNEGAAVHRVMLTDISEQKRLHEALVETNAQLAQAKSVADKASQAKSEFLSSMSHELRSPLNAILGFSQLMELAVPPPSRTQQDSLGQIIRAGWYLLELVNEILDLAAVESGKVVLSLEPNSLEDALNDCRSMVEPLALKRGIAVVFPQLEAPCFVLADHTRLKQVLVNLVSNAIKYNKPGGSVTVTLSVSPSGRVRVSVADTGEGLSAEKVAQLFQSFNRLGRQTGTEEGTGIGLMLSKRLVELMGGEIGARSTVGAGSVFWFELDQAGSPPSSPSGLAREVALADAAREQGGPLRTVLYVEDNPANLQLVEELIARRPDMKMIGATDGSSGLALARSEQPAIIVMDINLPDLSGLQVLQLLRDDPQTARIPVLALSANAMAVDVDAGIKAGFLRYLTKPIRIAEFMEAIDQALELATQRS